MTVNVIMDVTEGTLSFELKQRRQSNHRSIFYVAPVPGSYGSWTLEGFPSGAALRPFVMLCSADDRVTIKTAFPE